MLFNPGMTPSPTRELDTKKDLLFESTISWATCVADLATTRSMRVGVHTLLYHTHKVDEAWSVILVIKSEITFSLKLAGNRENFILLDRIQTIICCFVGLSCSCYQERDWEQ